MKQSASRPPRVPVHARKDAVFNRHPETPRKTSPNRDREPKCRFPPHAMCPNPNLIAPRCKHLKTIKVRIKGVTA